MLIFITKLNNVFTHNKAMNYQPNDVSNVKPKNKHLVFECRKQEEHT